MPAIQSVKRHATDDELGSIEFDEDPDQCPICHRFGKPFRLSAVLIEAEPNQNERDELQIGYRCARRRCGRMFVARYTRSGRNSPKFIHFDSVPETPEKSNFSKHISEVSPSFISIHDQALAAEAAGLDQIAGIGFRKALEFLIKDFCVSRNDTSAEIIKRLQLGNVIKQFVDDPRLQTVAERAAWLGNDESHYVRKWEDKDITDLKTLIRVSANWIENVILTEKYSADMQPPIKTPKSASK
jgi:hypothetical protein